jgi:ribosomal protein L11 methyltransferase
MNHRFLCRISISTTTEAEDAVSELLARVSGEQPTTHLELHTRRTTVSVFSEGAPANHRDECTELRAGVRALRAFGLNVGSGKVSATRVRRENWAESWKRHFKPLEVGNTLLVKPSWSRRRAKRGQSVVILDPGLSFGTGQHATTWFCLQELARHRRPGQPQAFLDVGTGSGILAIAAAKLGYQPIEAFDFDPESVRVARRNARRNQVAGKLKLSRRDLTRLPVRSRDKFDVICANLISTLLIAERRRIVSRLKPGGLLVLAGILKREFAAVRRAFVGAGFVFVTSRRQREWTSGSFLLHAGKN